MEKLNKKLSLNVKKALDFLKSSDNCKKFVSQENNKEARKFLKANNVDVSSEDVIQIGYLIEGIFQDKYIENVSGGIPLEVGVAAVFGSLGVIWDTIEFQGADGWGQHLFYNIRNSKLGLGPETSANVTAGIGGVSHLVTGAACAGAGYGAVKFVRWLKNKKGG